MSEILNKDQRQELIAFLETTLGERYASIILTEVAATHPTWFTT